jgi:centromeric protein E
LNAVKKEIVDTDALIERYRSEISDLKRRLAEREKESEVPAKNRRLSAKEVRLSSSNEVLLRLKVRLATRRESSDERSQFKD